MKPRCVVPDGLAGTEAAYYIWKWEQEHGPLTADESRVLCDEMNSRNKKHASARNALFTEQADVSGRLLDAIKAGDHAQAVRLGVRGAEIQNEINRPFRERIAAVVREREQEALRPYRPGGKLGRVKKTLSTLQTVLSEILRAEPSISGPDIWSELQRRGASRWPSVVLSVGRLPRRRGHHVKWRDDAGGIHTASETYMLNKFLPHLRRRLGTPLRKRPAR